MENNQIVNKEQIVIKKREQWANVGEIIHNTEIKLQLKSQTSAGKLIEPKSIEQIVDSETALKVGKQELALLIAERKEITDKLNTVISRLMNPEKELQEKFAPVEKSIIALKQQKAANDLLIKQKSDEMLRLTTACQEHIINSEAVFKQKIASQISLAYEYALGKGDVKIEGLEAYLNKVKNKFTDIDFTINAPAFNFVHTTKEDLSFLWSKCNFCEPNFWIAEYHAGLTSKFEFFNIAISNKVAALENSKKLEAEAAELLAKEAANKTISATLTSMATNIETPVQTAGKSLKTVFELDMVDSEQNGLLIIAAFVGNFATTKQYIKVKNFFSLSIEQMSKTLVAIKNKDANFSCTGINFKQTDKL